VQRYRIGPGKKFRLDDFDPDDTGLVESKEAAARENESLQKKIGELQDVLYAERQHKVLVVLQGMDTSGKDGTIRNVMAAVDPQGIHVFAFKKPTEEELGHDFLWRVHRRVPAAGEIGIFNRSHYEDVVIVRLHELVPRKVWRKRYDQINDFERMLSESGTTILKFFLHISSDEQRKRLQARLDDPTRQWKFNPGDIEERKHWDSYIRAYRDAIQKTSTPWAPWYVVPANRKWYRNYVVASVLVEALKKLKMKYPQRDLSGVVLE
jgi:PPK2 family polyphosphate:nucleotide phosphotransferase